MTIFVKSNQKVDFISRSINEIEDPDGWGQFKFTVALIFAVFCVYFRKLLLRSDESLSDIGESKKNLMKPSPEIDVKGFNIYFQKTGKNLHSTFPGPFIYFMARKK